MSVIRLLVSYDGTDLSGFASQSGQRTVQGELESALSATARRSVAIVGAGRTDSGVHALGQVVSFDDFGLEPDRIVRALAGRLPKDVSVVDAAYAPDGWSARFSALSRSYVYLIWNADAPEPVIGRYTTWVNKPVDADAMRETLQHAVGAHDFSAFARVRPEQTPVREVTSITVEQDGALIRIGITANAFLHNMVRALVGSALEVGFGRKTPAWLRDVLESRRRDGAGDVAGPQGLCLVDVEYPDAAWSRRAELRWPYAELDQAGAQSRPAPSSGPTGAGPNPTHMFRELTGAAK